MDAALDAKPHGLVYADPASSSQLPPDSPLDAVPEKTLRRHSFFHPDIAQHRKQYLTFYYIYAALLIVLMWALLPIYWASLAYTTQHTQRLTVQVTDFDESVIGRSVISAVQQAQAHASAIPTLGWQVVNTGTLSSSASATSIADAVFDEQIWAAVVGEPTIFSKLQGRRED